MNYLLIGGTHDGEWMELHGEQRIKLPLQIHPDFPPPNAHVMEYYIRHKYLFDGGDPMEIFVQESLSVREAIQRLIDAYPTRHIKEAAYDRMCAQYGKELVLKTCEEARKIEQGRAAK